MGTHVNSWGLVIAGLGFVLTRFTVALAMYEDPLNFYLAGVVPLALGLGLAAFGVALAVAEVEASLVRTTAIWCVVGTATMLVLVVLTLLGSSTGGLPEIGAMRSRTYLSNFLIGGSVGGTLTGLYAARNRRQRDALRQQAHRLEVLNRMLRHEVLNAVSVIQGYAASPGEDVDAPAVIEEYATDIEQSIEDVKHLTDSGDAAGSLAPVDVADCLADSVERVAARHPDADVALEAPPADLAVRADAHLPEVFVHLLENAVTHAGDTAATVEVSVADAGDRVRVAVRDEGPGLPEPQRALLERGEIAEFDDPGSGFGLNVVQLLVERYGGDVETAVDEDGTTVTVALPRADGGPDALGPRPAAVAGLRPAAPQLAVTLVASVLAGVVYGLVAEALGGSVAFIGLYYGVQSTVVGWITHEFHSVVFGFAFAGLLSLAPARYRTWAPAAAAIGVGWGLVLWLVAAGVVAPVWLQLLGVPATVPNLSPMLLATHLAWGAVLGALTAAGYERLAP